MFFAAALAVLLGMAGLVRGSVPQSAAVGSGPSAASSSPIVIGGAYVREPANDVNAAAYFTIYNTTGTADQLVSVNSGAGGQATLHIEQNGAMSATGELTIPAKGSVTLEPGRGHVMIEKLYGPLKPGQTVNLELDFKNAGPVLVTAPVIAIAAPAPTAIGPS